MTAKPEVKSTAVAKADPQDGVGALPVSIQQAIALRKAQNLVAAKISETNWGKMLDLQTRRAVADWCARYQVDAGTELEVLGGRLYLTSSFYLRRLGELVEAGVVEYAVPDYVHRDERLDEVGTEEAMAEKSRRTMARIEFGIPDEATGACVFRLKLRALSKEIAGAGWCGGGTQKHKAGGKGDPVGDAEPIKTSATRAARRCLRQVVSHVPAFARQLQAAEHDASVLGIQVADELASTEAEIAQNRLIGTHPVATTGKPDPYAESQADLRLDAELAKADQPPPAA